MRAQWIAACAAALLLSGCDNPFEDDGPRAADPVPTVTVTASPAAEIPEGDPTPPAEPIDPLAGTKAKVQALEEVPSTEADTGDPVPASNMVAGRPGTFTTIADFMTTVLQDVDAYWADVFVSSGLP